MAASELELQLIELYGDEVKARKEQTRRSASLQRENRRLSMEVGELETTVVELQDDKDELARRLATIVFLGMLLGGLLIGILSTVMIYELIAAAKPRAEAADCEDSDHNYADSGNIYVRDAAAESANLNWYGDTKKKRLVTSTSSYMGPETYKYKASGAEDVFKMSPSPFFDVGDNITFVYDFNSGNGMKLLYDATTLYGYGMIVELDGDESGNSLFSMVVPEGYSSLSFNIGRILGEDEVDAIVNVSVNGYEYKTLREIVSCYELKKNIVLKGLQGGDVLTFTFGQDGYWSNTRYGITEFYLK